MDGLTGPVKFSEDGKRTRVELEILNLRNNSFVKVSATMMAKKMSLHEEFVISSHYC